MTSHKEVSSASTLQILWLFIFIYSYIKLRNSQGVTVKGLIPSRTRKTTQIQTPVVFLMIYPIPLLRSLMRLPHALCSLMFSWRNQEARRAVGMSHRSRNLNHPGIEVGGKSLTSCKMSLKLSTTCPPSLSGRDTGL